MYRRVLESAPGHAGVLNHLGLLRHQRGDAREALSLLRRAVEADPRSAACRLHLGLVHESAGDLEAALGAYREASGLEAGAADAPFNQGLVLLRLDRPREAEDCFRRALSLAPGDEEAALNLGRALAGQGRWEAACRAFERALARRPEWVAALSGQGGALRRLGRHDEALAAYRRALEVAPDDAGLHNNIGNVLRSLGRRREAQQSFERALARDRRLPEAHLNLARLRQEQGDLAGARSACRRALALAPDLAGGRAALASMLRAYLPRRFDPVLAAELLRLMRAPDVDPQDLALAAAAQVRARHRLPPDGLPAAGTAPLPVGALAGDPLLRELLARTLNVDPALESVLALLRRRLFLREPPLGDEGSGTEAELEPLCAALALQCFANEYLFSSSADEEARVEALAATLSAPSPGVPPERGWRRDLLRIAMYRPLWRVEAARGLEREDLSRFDDDFARVILRTLVEPREERRIAARIPSAGPVRDPVSRKVREQYEAAPYPRWLDIATAELSPLMESLVRRFAHWRPARRLAAGDRALVLGCGTGYEAAELASREPEIEVVAVDLSLASLAYASRMAAGRGLRNLRFLHGDLLELGELGGPFALVSASGVLHHLRDPLAGWQAALSRLAAGGLMRIGLYSAPARRSIARARRIIARHDIPATPEGLRAFRLRLLRGELGADLAALSRSPDLYSLSGLRDLLFHVEEHHFDLPGVAAALSRLGLRFIGFEHERADTVFAYGCMFPGDAPQVSLENWAAFEAAHPETFVAMYQFWCERPVSPEPPVPPRTPRVPKC